MRQRISKAAASKSTFKAQQVPMLFWLAVGSLGTTRILEAHLSTGSLRLFRSLETQLFAINTSSVALPTRETTAAAAAVETGNSSQEAGLSPNV
jgi:hypothetical protein